MIGCQTLPKPGGKSAPPQAAFQRFPVYNSREPRRNHYVPSGYMGDSDLMMSGAYVPTPGGPAAAATEPRLQAGGGEGPCLRVTYRPPGLKGWAGVYWQDPANNWGEVAGKAGYDLRGAARLSFWARGETGGEKVHEFRIGGLVGRYPDSDVASLGPMRLSKEWKRYAIDLDKKDLRHLIGGFGFFMNQYENPGGAVFYLDDIAYESGPGAPFSVGAENPLAPTGERVGVRGTPQEERHPSSPPSPTRGEGVFGISLKTEEGGLRVSVNSQFLFEIGRAVLRPESRRILNQVIDLLKAYPQNQVLIEGHTDSTGAADYDLELSRLRAQQVRDALIREGGFDAQRFEIVGYGKTRPVADNHTLVGRALNRRVELIILKVGEKK